MTLFEHRERQEEERHAPLAARMRPHDLDGLVGQEHLVGPGRVLRRVIEADQVPSMILWGPPGSGKTTLALIIARMTRSHVEVLSAVSAGTADLRRVVEEARERRGMHGQRTILFVDEIHRFNKAQQDVILPYVENGTITFIGATTENPSFEVIAPLLSRCRVYVLNPLTEEHIQALIQRALTDQEHGLGSLRVELEPEALRFLVTVCDGDARVALDGLQLAAHATSPDAQGHRRVTLETLQDALQRRGLRYDKGGDQHYDTISAFIKSVRGSDPDAAIYWLARMVEAGEDPLFIARRLVILAAEDIGLADPRALTVAVSCQQAVHFVGMPEGAIPLAEATVYLATAPKSNSAYAALKAAQRDARRTRNDPVPLHIRNPATPLMRRLGYGKGYKYAHDYAGHFVGQEYLPPAVRGHRYYVPTEEGYERAIAERIRRWWGERGGVPAPQPDEGGEQSGAASPRDA